MKNILIFVISAISAVLTVSLYDKASRSFGDFVIDDAVIIADSLMNQAFYIAVFLYTMIFALLPAYFASKFINWIHAALIVSLIPTITVVYALYMSNMKVAHVAEISTFFVFAPLLVSTISCLSAVHNKSFKRTSLRAAA